MTTNLSRRGFFTGAMAVASLAALPFGGAISTEALAVPAAESPFIVILDEWGFYAPDFIDMIAVARSEPCPVAGNEPSIGSMMIDMMRAAA